jgi:hypothetical protein
VSGVSVRGEEVDREAQAYEGERRKQGKERRIRRRRKRKGAGGRASPQPVELDEARAVPLLSRRWEEGRKARERRRRRRRPSRKEVELPEENPPSLSAPFYPYIGSHRPRPSCRASADAPVTLRRAESELSHSDDGEVREDEEGRRKRKDSRR